MSSCSQVLVMSVIACLSSPLLEEKLVMETDTITWVTQQQEEVSVCQGFSLNQLLLQSLIPTG